MTQNEREKYGIIWTFSYFDDTIVYKRLIECDTRENAIDYAVMFVEKYGKKYGKCLFATIVLNAVDITTIYFSTRNSGTVVEYINHIY